MRWIISANIKIHGVGVGSLDDYGLTLSENGPTSHIAMVLSMHEVMICLTLLTHFSRQGRFYELFVFRFPQWDDSVSWVFFRHEKGHISVKEEIQRSGLGSFDAP